MSSVMPDTPNDRQWIRILCHEVEKEAVVAAKIDSQSRCSRIALETLVALGEQDELRRADTSGPLDHEHEGRVYLGTVSLNVVPDRSSNDKQLEFCVLQGEIKDKLVVLQKRLLSPTLDGSSGSIATMVSSKHGAKESEKLRKEEGLKKGAEQAKWDMEKERQARREKELKEYEEARKPKS